MRHIISHLVWFSFAATALACSSATESPNSKSAPHAASSDGYATSPSSSAGSEATPAPPIVTSDGVSSGVSRGSATPSDIGASAPSAGAPTGTESSEGAAPAPIPQAGLLTSGVWDDNRNLARFLGYRTSQHNLGLLGLPLFDVAEHQAAQAAFAKPSGPKQTLDISLVIDTTGSMGDEMNYLKSEFVSISTRIGEHYPNSEQHWSLVLYKDIGDEYVVRSFDFSPDATAFQTHLAEQSASGGGDFPEAPEQGLQKMTQLGWRSDEQTAKLVFWVADAPYHDSAAAAFTNVVRTARDLKIHIYPVASSGVDEFTELTMRSAAQVTGGRYMFLTNDSGIGAEHKEPSIPCYFVTRLDAAMLRMIDIEMTGVYREPTRDQILRTGGNPQDGACKLTSGETAIVF